MGITQAARAAPGGLLSVLKAGHLIPIMRDYRARTVAPVADLNNQQLIGPRLAIVNPPLWEMGHIAWFQEFWILRHLRKQQAIMKTGDQLYNSTDVAHDSRWELLLPSLDHTREYMDNILERCIKYIDRAYELSPEECEFYYMAA